MRFEDWDVLLFPRDSKIPMKEFKTNCHVVHDNEFAYSHGSYGLPTMTCFMPGLSPGTQFNISLHSWKTPDISQFTRSYSKHPELVKFEARVLIDGRLVASSALTRTGPWPQLINHSFEFTKNGDLETLRFPPFRSEVLQQSYWSPADEIGRIKIVISEGFPRDSLSVPIERVKNVVAFSFQHAPLDILESSGIAWPNPGMWRRTPFNPTMPVPSQRHEDGPDAHLHSPRRRTTSYMKGTSNSSGYNPGPPGLIQANTNGLLSSMPNTQALLQRNETGSGSGSGSSWADPFSTQKSEATACFDWANSNFGPIGFNQTTDSGKSNCNHTSTRRTTGMSKASRSDMSMLDYGLNNSNTTQGISDHQFLNLSTSNLGDADTATNNPKVPSNTPTTLAGTNFIDELNIDVSKIDTPGGISAQYLNSHIAPPQNDQDVNTVNEADKCSTIGTSMNDFFNSSHANFSSELANSLTHSLLNQPHPLPVYAGNIVPPAPEVKSRKENRLHQDSPNENVSTIDHVEMRKVSQPSFCSLGKETQDNSSNNSPPSQGTFSGVFSHRSTSTADFGNDLTNCTNIFQHSNADSHICGDAAPEIRITGCPDKGIKRTRHFTSAGGKVIDDTIEALTNSPQVQIDLDEQFGAPM
ncbi:NADH dehydrogenase (ubiquinone)-like protein [Daldinia childiae]|uniref:NADH dehydrogenase (ubiquinone)-like protein n=1 Tax=Daldinia childiae TaxID=326645 RepID=UPI00144563A6|nr:NADH dehydrogenase (ubiquinone)-like protein [Daldinia childiae]KAF3062820.1 NADH dehydrogenase (ubiquinone)-like protein [Daldinia childiae]